METANEDLGEDGGLPQDIFPALSRKVENNSTNSRDKPLQDWNKSSFQNV
jgi:hypothetical protein